MKLICVLCILLFASCNSKTSNKLTKQESKVDSLKNTLLGQWGGLGENSPVLKINIDSIYYYEENKSYPYKIVDKDLIIERLETKGVLRNISVNKDTLIFYDEQGLTTKGYRFKTIN